jgi:hypothetical protein
MRCRSRVAGWFQAGADSRLEYQTDLLEWLFFEPRSLGGSGVK